MPSPRRLRRAPSRSAARLIVVALVAGVFGIVPLPAAALPASAPTSTATPTDTATPAPVEPTPEATKDAVPAPEPAPSPQPVESPAPSASPEPSPQPAPTTTATASPVAPDASNARLRAQARSFSIMAANVAEEPIQVWAEPFTSGNVANVVQAGSYAGYTGDPFWFGSTAYANCNGLLLTYNVTSWGTNNCTTAPQENARLNVRRLADVLGQVGTDALRANGSATAAGASSANSTADTRNNRALIEWTSGGQGGAGLTEVISRTTNIAPTLNGQGQRFYAASIDLAEASCDGQFSRARIVLSLTEPASGSQSSEITACTDARALFYTSPLPSNQPNWINGGTAVRAGRFVADNAQLLTAAQVAQQRPTVRNLNLGSGGNDFAVDNLRVMDVSPSVDIAFSEGTAVAGVPTRLVYTITNTTELGAKNNWAFVNTLPQGLTLTGGVVSTDCGDGALVSSTDPRVVSFSGGDLAANVTSCTIEVDVVAEGAGTFTNNAAAFGTLTGLIGPDAATLTATAGTQIVLAKSLPSGRNATGDQFVLSLRQGAATLASATTTGSGTQVGYTTAQVRRTVTPGQTYTIHEQLSGGAGLGYGSTYSCVRSGTVIASGQSTSGTLTVPEGTPAEIVCTFSNTIQTARFMCDVNHFYSVSSAGAVRQADIVSGASELVGTIPMTGTEQVNGLALRQPGTGTSTEAFALVRQNSTATNLNVSRIVKMSAGGVVTTLYSTTLAATVGAIGGAMDAEGRYLFGGYDTAQSRFILWSYTEGGGAPVQLGSVSTPGTPAFGNGDIAFDARGNLYILGAASAGDTQAAIFTVTRASLETARQSPSASQVIPRSDTIRKTLTGTDSGAGLTSVNGIAFSPRGTTYLSDGSNAYEFDPTTMVRIPGSAVVESSYTDLASCSSPSTIAVQKNVVGRAAAADQFTLTLEAANGTVDVATTTTTGSATGIQAQQIGPVPAPIGTELTITEAMATGSTNLIATYRPIYECWSGGVRIAAGSAATGTVTMPQTLSTSVNCTFFNTPQPVSSLTITKQVQNPATGTSAAASGWTVGAALTPTAGYATALPSEAATQQTNAQGQAVWTLLYGATTARATLTVSEVQQTGFAFVSGSCTVNGTAQATTFTQVGNEVRASIANTQSSSAIACTFVNRPIATLTLQKVVSQGSLAANSWTLSAARPSANALAGPSGTTGVSATVSPGVAYTLSESTSAAGSSLYGQVGPWACTTATGATVAVNAQSQVTLTGGTSVTCRVTNATARLTLVKDVQNPGPGFQPADWTLTATPAAYSGSGGALPTNARPGALYSAGNNAASTFDVRPGHPYTLTEAVTAQGSRLAYLQVRLERLVGTTWTTVTSPTITAPAAGETAVYRFVNAPVPAWTLPMTGGYSTDAFLFAGGFVLLLMLAGGALHARRRSRRAA